jgi:hypothetical protein
MNMAAAVVCLQAQHVTGLPASVHQVDLGCHLHHPHHLEVDAGGDEPAVLASARVSGGGVADFQNQVLLLHCALASSVVVTVSLSLLSDDDFRRPRRQHRQQQYLELDLGAEQRPGVLSFQLTAGAVLTLALHRKLLPPPATTTTPCLPLPACCRRHRRHRQRRQGYDSSDESSGGFIVIEKRCRRPPSDNLLTTDDDDDQDAMKLELDRVEDEFLAMLELAETADTRLDLDMLVRDAEAELFDRRTLLLSAAA